MEAEKLVSGNSSTPGEREHHGVVSGDSVNAEMDRLVMHVCKSNQ